MKIKEVVRDLFSMPQGYYLAHCISGDYALGAGIAQQFDETYNMRYKLFKYHPIPEEQRFASVGKALLVDNVFNLVTKQRYFQKPTYDTLYEALGDLREQCEALSISRIAIPRLGCGLDKLDWDKVKSEIEAVFEDSDIDIIVCRL